MALHNQIAKSQNKQPVILYLYEQYKNKSNNILPASLNQNAATCRSCTTSYLKRCQNVNYGSLDGKDDKGKTVSNPNAGYGSYTIKYADGTTREFYQIGLSANTTGISVYIMGIKDKTYLANTYGKKLGKASVTGYCIKFKTIKDINIDILQAAIRDGVEITGKSN